ncbi:MAG TPA: FliM/FliN family flagellar motor switch protein [Symbiobacteriaceae bacterium]|nr:FliM/FliN family flagellar motor switch protein [Symbiobacteriaceae bacterium]
MKLTQAEIDDLVQKMISGEISPEEMEAAMSGGGDDHAPAPAPGPAAHVAAAEMPNLGPITQAEVDTVLRQAGKEGLIATPSTPAPGVPPIAAPPVQPALAPAALQVPLSPAAQIMMDLELTMTAELVRTRLRLNQLLMLQPGAVLELNHRANEPVDLIVGGRPVMKAKVVTIGENYGVQITRTGLRRTAS